MKWACPILTSLMYAWRLCCRPVDHCVNDVDTTYNDDRSDLLPPLPQVSSARGAPDEQLRG
jgi:hypothetical protein